MTALPIYAIAVFTVAVAVVLAVPPAWWDAAQWAGAIAIVTGAAWWLRKTV
jgi:hypothetical protein